MWYYMCSKCPKMVYPKNNHFVCADHDIIPYPKYMYCVNATINDHTSDD
ncbi:putative nucleic acid-binding protein [Helianthus annuus]|uniref:Nucleic acid-binding protein n=1 Tax=Helianthus annuus TaxID=4232 RepID=A0A9K3GVH5_HELAN|nr:putative nucleic acid-binding protein [Helianthus annuus]KAJ0449175.1 putative nucleic acid-binding protein [Helianthus annuus]KAJ0449176.1 putative nucleic acid-binding protein [Helianthus annuus]KAJ0637827.1 putative nucleic acid-binding protein [Helianthus annuus]KAJ0828318.1 putative nucleic acid-binding protein [Helianthus annuus]